MSLGEAITVQQLREAGLRVTAPRYAVLEWLAEHPHATAEEVRAGTQERLGTVSRQAVYDVLAACVEADLVRRIELAGHPARFERRTGDNHHHLVCRWCGAIEDIDCAVGARPCLTPSGDRGFTVDEADVVFWGSCPRCRSMTVEDPGTASPALGDEQNDQPHTHETTEV